MDKELLSNRVNKLSESETLAMTRRSRFLMNQGIDVINLSIGEPDFDTPDVIKDAGIEAIQQNFSHYTPVGGYLELREAVCTKLKRDNGLSFAPDQIVVSNGAKHSLANLTISTINPGDEVIIPTPYWVTYIELVRLAHGIIVPVQTKIEDDFKISPEDLEAAISPRTKLLILNTPCNPTGSVYSREELRAIANVLRKYKHVMVISDEIYEHILFENEHCSIAEFDFLKDRVAVVNGVSKGFAMTGWRIGYVAAPRFLASAIHKLQGQISSAPSSIAQRAAIKALQIDPKEMPELEMMRKAFKNRRDLLISLLNEIPGIKSNVPSGAFYLFPQIDSYFKKTDGKVVISNSSDLAMYLLNEEHIAVVPGDAFGEPKCIRISYATSEPLIIEAIKRIKSGLEKLR